VAASAEIGAEAVATAATVAVAAAIVAVAVAAALAGNQLESLGRRRSAPLRVF